MRNHCLVGSLPTKHERLELLFKRFMQYVRIGKATQSFSCERRGGNELSAAQLGENWCTPLSQMQPQLRVEEAALAYCLNSKIC